MDNNITHNRQQAVTKKIIRLPLYLTPVQAGLPSPADDYIELSLDLNEHLLDDPQNTFCVRVQGNSMQGANIHPGDILVVDRSKPARNGKVVVAVVNGEFTVKRLSITDEGTYLMPEHPAYHPIPIGPDMDVQIWGVVTYTIHKQ